MQFHSSGVCCPERAHDAGGHDHGGLPARRPAPQLLPQYNLVSRSHRTRCRFLTDGARPSRSRYCHQLSRLVDSDEARTLSLWLETEKARNNDIDIA